MGDYSKIKNAIREIVNVHLTAPITGVVKAIAGDVCSIQLPSGLIITEVKLKATAGGDDYILLTPKIGSKVTCISLSGDVNNLFVAKVDNVEKMEYKQNGLEILVDSADGKVSVKNQSTSLIDVLQALATLLKQLKVFTPVGPSGTPLPDTILAITDFETKFKAILK